MDYKDDFVVVLPSNTPCSIKNTPASYLTTFLDPFFLDGNWEVALLEVDFKNSIKTIHQDYALIQKTVMHHKASIEDREFTYHGSKVTIPDDNDFIEIYDENNKRINAVQAWEINDLNREQVFLSCNDIDVIYANKQFFMRNHTDFDVEFKITETMAFLIGLIDLKLTNNKFIYTNKYITVKLENKDVKILNPKILTIGKKSYVPFHPNIKENFYNLTYKSYGKTSDVEKVTPNPGTYANAKDLETELNKNIQFNSLFKFIYDERLNRFEIKKTAIGSDKYSLKLFNGLNDVLGFTGKEFTDTHKGELQVNLSRGISSIFIYCDLCTPQRVGNTVAPLLRNVAFNNTKYGEIIQKTYSNPIYIPVTKSFVDNVQITLCDSTGEIVPFVEGLTTCILHFRRL